MFKYIKASYVVTADFFSVKICLSTLFAPWKRDSIGYDGMTLGQRFNIWALNLASRFIGMLVKLATIFVYLLGLIIQTVFWLAVLAVWLAYPVVLVYLLYKVINPS